MFKESGVDKGKDIDMFIGTSWYSNELLLTKESSSSDVALPPRVLSLKAVNNDSETVILARYGLSDGLFKRWFVTSSGV